MLLAFVPTSEAPYFARFRSQHESLILAHAQGFSWPDTIAVLVVLIRLSLCASLTGSSENVASFHKVTFLLIISRVLMIVLESSFNENLGLYSPIVMGINDLGVTALSCGPSVIVNSTLKKASVFWRLNHVEGLGSE